MINVNEIEWISLPCDKARIWNVHLSLSTLSIHYSIYTINTKHEFELITSSEGRKSQPQNFYLTKSQWTSTDRRSLVMPMEEANSIVAYILYYVVQRSFDALPPPSICS